MAERIPRSTFKTSRERSRSEATVNRTFYYWEHLGETVEDFLKTLRPEEYLLCEQDSFQNKATYCPTGQLPDIELFIEEKKENNLTVIRPAFSKPV